MHYLNFGVFVVGFGNDCDSDSKARSGYLIILVKQYDLTWQGRIASPDIICDSIKQKSS